MLGEPQWALAILATAVLAGAAVQGLVGLGLGLVAAPVAALVAPSLMPSSLLWLAALLPMLHLWHSRDHIDWRGIAWMMPARIPGTVLGALLVATVSVRGLGGSWWGSWC